MGMWIVFVYLLGDRIKNTLDSLCMKDGHIAANAYSSSSAALAAAAVLPYLLHNLRSSSREKPQELLAFCISYGKNIYPIISLISALCTVIS